MVGLKASPSEEPLYLLGAKCQHTLQKEGATTLKPPKPNTPSLDSNDTTRADGHPPQQAAFS